MNDFFLEGRDLAELSAGSDDQLEFVGRVDGTLANLARAEYAEHDAGRPTHHKKEGAADGEENVHGACDGQGNLFSTL